MNDRSKLSKVRDEFIRSLSTVSIKPALVFIKPIFSVIIIIIEAIIALIPASLMGFLFCKMFTSNLLFVLIYLIVIVLLYFLIFAINKVYGEKTKENWYCEVVRISTWYTTLLAPIVTLCMRMGKIMEVYPKSFIVFGFAVLLLIAIILLLGIPTFIHEVLIEE